MKIRNSAYAAMYFNKVTIYLPTYLSTYLILGLPCWLNRTIIIIIIMIMIMIMIMIIIITKVFRLHVKGPCIYS